ncbi:MAG: retron St85 family RNA-directed DNA polymerase [Gallionellaceae bacterium]|nr:retron St85 family RNA-directed DNA polymerase [Gallionellaceae bacterium]
MNLLERLTREFPITEREARILLLTAPSRYKTHYIEKRHGRGRRLIAQPTAEVKLLQRWALTEYVSQLPIHEAATAYRTGIGIREHAGKHADKHYLLKLDFKDFFPSILGNDFLLHAKSYASIAEADAEFLMRLLFRYDKEKKDFSLSIGAPSSPAVSNTIMYNFDCRLTSYCHEHEITYTRYADDLALSTNAPKRLDNAHIFVQHACSELPYPRLVLNHEKTVFTSKKHKRLLTGLVLSNNGQPSLGREKKRIIRSMAHHYSKGELTHDEISYLRGMLAFTLSIEPLFVQSLKTMIGEDAYKRLMKG